MMHCSEIKPLLSAYLDGELSSGEIRMVEEHLEHCPACAAYRQKINQAGRLVREMAVPPVSPDLTQRIIAQVTRQTAYSGGLLSLFGTVAFLLLLTVPALIFLSPAGGLLFALVRIMQRNLFALFHLGTKLPVNAMNLFWSFILLVISGLLFYGVYRAMHMETTHKKIIHEN